MKTPDEIKKGLERCSMYGRVCFPCPYEHEILCKARMTHDALTYIQQLEKRLADVNASPFDGGMSQAEYFNGEAGKDAE